MKTPLKTILTILLLIGFCSFNLPKNIEKKVTKEITSYFEIESYSRSAITIADRLNSETPTNFSAQSFFKLEANNKHIGYLYVGEAPSKTDKFDYMVLFDAQLNIIKSKVLIYREDYGNEIGSKRWLKQFVGKTSKDNLQYEKNIDAIAGATISAKSMTVAVNDLLKSISILQENKVL